MRKIIALIVLRFCESLATKQEEPQSMTENSDQEHTPIERHERKHNQVSQTDPKEVQHGLNQTGSDVVRTGFDEPSVGEPLNEERHHENEHQRQRIHATTRTRPLVEQNRGLCPPEECHVREMTALHHHGWWWRHPYHASHVMHAMIMVHVVVIMSFVLWKFDKKQRTQNPFVAADLIYGGFEGVPR